MRTKLKAEDEDGNIFNIFVDLNQYELEECEDGVYIYHMYKDITYKIIHTSFNTLHYMCSGFNQSFLN